jgi:hypothetical protein
MHGGVGRVGRSCRASAGSGPGRIWGDEGGEHARVQGDRVGDALAVGAVRDYERLTARHEIIVYWAMIITMRRRLARQNQTSLPLPRLT